MKALEKIAIPVATLAVGAALGYVLRPMPEPLSTSSEDSSAYTETKSVDDVGESATTASLRKRITELERELAASRAKMAETKVEAVAQDEKGEDRFGPGRRGGHRERLEQLKRDNPEMYERMKSGIARMEKRRQERNKAKIDYLASFDTSRMSSAAARNHTELQSQIAKRESLEAKLHDENLTDEEREQTFEDMRDADRAMRDLNASERENLIKLVAEDLGLDSSAADDFSSTILDIVSATESGGRDHGGPPPSGDGGGMPPPMM